MKSKPSFADGVRRIPTSSSAWTAVQERGRVVRCGVIRFQCDGAFLQLILPSGRKLSYMITTTLDIGIMTGIVMFIAFGLALRRDAPRRGPHRDSPYRGYEDTP